MFYRAQYMAPRASGSAMQINRDKWSARNASGPKGEAQMFNNFEDMQTMGKANVDATMKSFEAVTKEHTGDRDRDRGLLEALIGERRKGSREDDWCQVAG